MMTTVTETKSVGKSNILELSPEKKVRKNPPVRTTLKDWHSSHNQKDFSHFLLYIQERKWKNPQRHIGSRNKTGGIYSSIPYPMLKKVFFIHTVKIIFLSIYTVCLVELKPAATKQNRRKPFSYINIKSIFFLLTSHCWILHQGDTVASSHSSQRWQQCWL